MHLKIYDLRIRKIKWFVQRLFRGFSDEDIWCLDCHLAKLILKRLRFFRNHAHNCIEGLSEKEWDSILDKMIWAFDYAANDYLNKKGKNCVDLLKKCQEGINLFAEYFVDLWT